MKYNFTFLLVLFSTVLFAQEDAWVYFTGKPNAQDFFNNPSQTLSQRSLDRRTAQNIALNLTDAPLETTYVDQVKTSTGITVLAQSKWLNALHIRGTQNDINALKLLSFVDKVVFANKTLNGTSKKASVNKISEVKKNSKQLLIMLMELLQIKYKCSTGKPCISRILQDLAK